MDELLGFVVLTGPLFPILAWLVVSVLLVRFIVKPTGSNIRRTTLKLLAFLLVLLLPFSDEITGQLYLTYLCETQGGFKVYKTVELPDEYWDEHGDARFIKYTSIVNIPQLDKVNGALDFSALPEYSIDSKDETYSSFFDIQLFKHWYYEKETGKILAEHRFFSYGQGWVIRKFSPNSGVSCNTSGQPNEKEKILSVFLPINNLKNN